MLSRALSTIFVYRSRGKKLQAQKEKPSNNIITIDLYNILLHGYAGKGSFERFQELFKFIHEDGLLFNEQTYAAIFECLGRVEPDAKNLQLIEHYIKEAEEQGFSLNQIMDRSKFISDQRDIALDAIRRIHPDFTPVYVPPQLGYNNELLNDLNAQVITVGTKSETSLAEEDCVIMKSKRGYSKEQLEQLAREQLQVELDGSITIKSIEKSKEFANSEYCVSDVN